jgi:hemerythrin-like domain-containing protein
MNPVKTMEAEHRLIETVVKALGAAAAAIEQGGRADAAMLTRAVEFLRVYADKLHHGKEELLFFPMLVKRGVPPQGCPIGGLNHEHEKGRLLVQSLAQSAAAYEQDESASKDTLLKTLRALADLYQNHIWKEDAMVFPMAEKVLTAADQQELSEKFAEVDSAIGLDVRARLENFARGLASDSQAPSANPALQGGSGCGCSA